MTIDSDLAGRAERPVAANRTLTVAFAVLVLLTGLLAVGGIVEMVAGSPWHSVAYLAPFVLVTTALSRWSQRRRVRRS